MLVPPVPQARGVVAEQSTFEIAADLGKLEALGYLLVNGTELSSIRRCEATTTLKSRFIDSASRQEKVWVAAFRPRSLDNLIATGIYVAAAFTRQ